MKQVNRLLLNSPMSHVYLNTLCEVITPKINKKIRDHLWSTMPLMPFPIRLYIYNVNYNEKL
jgi:hypothetical protein